MSELEKQLQSEGLDADVIKEVVEMSEQQRKEEATDVVAQSAVHKVEKQLTKPEPLPLTFEQQKAQRLMIEAGGEPQKTEKFLRSNEGYAVDETNATSIVETQRLRPDKHYAELANKEAVDDAVSQFIKEEPPFSTKLPWDLVQQIVSEMKTSSTLESALYHKNKALSVYIEAQQTEYTEWLDNHLKALHCPITLRLKLLSELPKDSEEAMALLNRARKQMKK